MQVLKVKVAKTMSTFEKVFPPMCFDVMTHLVVHLVEELDLCGPLHTRWMYPMERYMKALKGYVRNVVQSKGNMVTGYAIEKVLGFCTEYIQGFQFMKRKMWDDKEELPCMMKYLKVMGALID
jgi:hypothetical protein